MNNPKPSKASAKIPGALLLAAMVAAPAFAQVDFSGEWAPLYHEDGPERLPGPELADYTELPINDGRANAGRQLGRGSHLRGGRIPVPSARRRLLDARLGQPARLARDRSGHASAVIALHTHMLAWDSERTIYMDGRAHPPDYAHHTWQGFSTGVWEGNMLTITTTHLKENYIRRNGVPRSDKAIVTEHWTRHGDYLTVTTVIEDPVFLTEPLVRSDNWYLDPGQHIGIFGCEYAAELPQPEGTVPHHLPDQNPYLHEFADYYGLPL